jgi:molybdate transport system substrate-binding protein
MTCVHVAAAVSLEEVLGQLLTEYALRQPAVQVRTVFGASDELANHVLGGAPADLFLTADTRELDRLGQAAIVERDTPTPLAENTLAAICPADRPLPVRRPADLLGPRVDRVALAASSCPLGGYTRTYLESLGLYDALLARAILVENSRRVVATVQAGQADAGLAYGSLAAAAPACRILFRVRRTPAPIQYVGAVIRRGQQPEEARLLLKFLASKQAERRFRRCGFLPVRGRRPGAASRD